MSWLPRLLLASQLSKRVLQQANQNILNGANKPHLSKPFTTTPPSLKNNKHAPRSPSLVTNTSSAKPQVHSAKTNPNAPPGSVAAGPKVVVGTAGTDKTPKSVFTGEKPNKTLDDVSAPVHDTGAAVEAPTLGAKGSPTTAGVKSPASSGGVNSSASSTAGLNLPASSTGGVKLPASSGGGGGGGGTRAFFVLLATLGAGGAGYYYWDDLKGYVLTWGQENALQSGTDVKKAIEEADNRAERAVQVGKKSSDDEGSKVEQTQEESIGEAETKSGENPEKEESKSAAELLSEAAKPVEDRKESGKEEILQKEDIVVETVSAPEAASTAESQSELNTFSQATSTSETSVSKDPKTIDLPATSKAQEPQAQKSPSSQQGGEASPQRTVKSLLEGAEEEGADAKENDEERGVDAKGSGEEKGADVSTPSADVREKEVLQILTKTLQDAVKREGAEEETEASQKAKEHVHNLKLAFEEVEKRTSDESEELSPESLVLKNIQQSHEKAEQAKREAENLRQEAFAQRQREEQEHEEGYFQRPIEEEKLAPKPKTGSFEELVAGAESLAQEAERLKREHLGLGGTKGDAAIGALIAEAVKEAVRSQAETDSTEFRRKIEELHEEHRAELADARAEALRHAQIVHKLERDLSRQKLAYRNALREQLRKGEEKRLAELQANLKRAEALVEEARTTAATKAALTIAEERKQRAEQMDEVRMKVNALQNAFSSRSKEAQKSHTAHKLAMGAFALEDALDSGRPLEKEVRLLAEAVDGNDPLVMAALSSLPPQVAEHGAPTRAQLQEQFEHLQGRAKQLALLPPDGGGMLAHALAWVASSLKVKEPASQDQPNSATSDAALARSEALLASGKLVEAAEVLAGGFKGTCAEGLVHTWAEEARSRAVAEQVLAVIQAQATSLAASLS